MSTALRRGELIEGRYFIEGVLGSGGMATVYAGRLRAFDVPVAIKVLHPHVASIPEACSHFLREVEITARLRSEHAVRILDSGVLASGLPFMVLERLEGTSLADVCRERAPLRVAEAVRYVIDACDALAEAHALGVVHRDLKPANIFLARGAGGAITVKLVDFGIAKLLDDGAARVRAGAAAGMLTKDGVMIGSPSYMSPEQIRGASEVDTRTDIWSLGVLLYVLLTGERPFSGETTLDILSDILLNDPTPPRERRPEIPGALEAAILRCLEKDRARRFPDVMALCAALAAGGAGALDGPADRRSLASAA